MAVGDFSAPLRFARNDGEGEVSAVRYRLSASGCWLLAIGFQLLAFGYRCAFGNPPPRHCVALSPLTSSGAQESI